MNTAYARLRSNGRAKDPIFGKQEKLFLRFSEECIADGHFLPTAFDLPVQSVNREKYSEPLDVLIPVENPEEPEDKYATCGVAEMDAGIFPIGTIHPDTKALFELIPQHEPTKANYAHSEIWLMADGHGPVKPKAKTIKEELRAALYFKLRVIKAPE